MMQDRPRSQNFRWHAWRLDFGPAGSDQTIYMIRLVR